jgi:phytoene dehydrogenase-like protein
MINPSTTRPNKKRVVVIGAGLGGMTAAIQLARAGYSVDLLEKNSNVGGKLNIHREAGFSFDLGPSIFTLPHIFRPIFEENGRTLDDYIHLERVDPQWRNFFEDGTVVDLWENPAAMRHELERLGPGAVADYQKFREYSKPQYNTVERGYFKQGLGDTIYLQRFAVETRGGEIAHWSMLFCFPLFYFWNPPWALMINAVYAVAANLPCIFVQRYNRETIRQLLLLHRTFSGCG